MNGSYRKRLGQTKTRSLFGSPKWSGNDPTLGSSSVSFPGTSSRAGFEVEQPKVKPATIIVGSSLACTTTPALYKFSEVLSDMWASVCTYSNNLEACAIHVLLLRGWKELGFPIQMCNYWQASGDKLMEREAGRLITSPDPYFIQRQLQSVPGHSSCLTETSRKPQHSHDGYSFSWLCWDLASRNSTHKLIHSCLCITQDSETTT